MSSLPSEILTLIFNHFEIHDLLQCQLTSKQWHINSLTHMYSEVNLNSGEDARLFKRAISNSPQLGKYLNLIDLSGVLEERIDEEGNEMPFDRFCILEATIQHCPNITEIKCDEKDASLWTRLMHAGIRGQLLHLKVLPEPDYMNWESYVYTALLFKNSLTSLHVCGDDSVPGYRTICDEIDQYKNLQRLNFRIRSYTYLTNFDGLIDRCPHLKELTFDIETDATQQPNGPEPTIRPRPDIHKLECDWKLICTENQLEYIMRKFPNLQSLASFANDRDPEVSGPALIKFIQYATSTPDFSLRLFVRKEDLLNIFIEFMKTKNGCKNVSIGCSKYPLPTFVLCDLFLSVKSGAFLILPLNTGDNKIAHIQFLSETGRLFRSLNLHDFCGVPDINGEASKSIDRLFDILQLCPLLEECTISRALSILASRRKSKYPSLKKLSILGVEHSKSLGFLNSLSLNLPNLCEFSLGFVFYCNRSTNPVVIDMPHSSLDLLTWYEHRSLNYNGDEKTYIKLKTERELRYYSCNRDALLPVNDSRYLLATQNARFDINCKDLKEVKILDEYHGDHYSWIF